MGGLISNQKIIRNTSDICTREYWGKHWPQHMYFATTSQKVNLIIDIIYV